MNHTHLQHLYWRAGFSLSPVHTKKIQEKSRKEVVTQLFMDSKNYTSLQIASVEDLEAVRDYRNLAPSEKRAIQKKNRQQIASFNIAWFQKMKSHEAVLRERMTLFWANHFVCKAQNYYHIEQFNNVLRKNALGDFRVFVHEVSKSASMLKYLNAKQNKKQSPNENFARELMELFTLGIGNYSEKDIKEAARAFTGWNHNLKGDFVLRKRQHDYGQKEFFNKTGNFEGEDIIDIILNEKQCALFICKKIYNYFVSTNSNQDHIEELANVFYPSYNISAVMEHLFMADWFYQEEFIGTKIKSPIELLLGIDTIAPISYNKPRQLIYIQKQLGQQLLNPINVAGWEGGQTWIDTNTLMLRLKLPSILLNNAVISLQGIEEFEDTYEQYLEKRASKKSYFKVDVDWKYFDTNFANVSTKDMQQLLLSSKLSPEATSLLKEIEASDKKAYCIQLMSLPEYQLC